MDGLGRRVLVAAFDGWNDAGEAASAALAQLRERRIVRDPRSRSTPSCTSTTSTRVRRSPPTPTASGCCSGRRRRSIARSARHARNPAVAADRRRAGARLAGVRGGVHRLSRCARTSPASWRSASMMSDVPHTRPISIFAGSENERAAQSLELERSTLRGPGRASSACIADAAEPPASRPRACGRASRTTSPATRPPPRRRSRCSTGSKTSRARRSTAATSPTESAAWEASIDAAAADDEEMTEYIRQLERTRDTGTRPRRRRRDRAGVRALPPPRRRRRRADQARPRRAAPADRHARRRGRQTWLSRAGARPGRAAR